MGFLNPWICIAKDSDWVLRSDCHCTELGRVPYTYSTELGRVPYTYSCTVCQVVCVRVIRNVTVENSRPPVSTELYTNITLTQHIGRVDSARCDKCKLRLHHVYQAAFLRIDHPSAKNRSWRPKVPFAFGSRFSEKAA